MMHTIINLDDVFYSPLNNVEMMPAPVSNLDLTNPMVDKNIFSTNPNDFIDRLRVDNQFI